MKKIILGCAVFLFVFGDLSPRTQAEVRVRTAPGGEYLSTQIVPGGPPWRKGIWSSRARGGMRRGGAVLNAWGDRLGDLYPAIGEQNQTPHHPWAVWSRFNGSDYDLVYSWWTYAWSPITRVTIESLGGDDLDPDVAFSRAGRPWVAWWNRDLDDGHGSVYYSVFGNTGWIEPVKISNDTVGGRRPTIEIKDQGMLIHYRSDDGSERITSRVALFDPNTITDDIDPQGTLSDGSKDLSDKQ
jgi:hypothetical protein